MKFTIAYTLLFFYVIAAIMFWGFSLNKQNELIYNLEKEKLELILKNHGIIQYQNELTKINTKKHRRVKQFLGEGATFILITILSASVVYIAYYRQRKLSALQKNFMLSITHELKTPIAGIKLNMQTLEKRKLDETIQLKLVKSAVSETNRLNDLCNNILIATQLESTKKALYTERIHLSKIIEEVVAEIKSRFPELQLEVHIHAQEFTFEGDASLWKLVISNLLENARKYSPSDECIEIDLEKKEQRIVLSIKDKGIGIPDSEKKKIFEKFYRIGSENTRSSKGTGLGLFIVKKIVALYKYDITVRNNSPKGSIFEIRF